MNTDAPDMIHKRDFNGCANSKVEITKYIRGISGKSFLTETLSVGFVHIKNLWIVTDSGLFSSRMYS